MKLVISSYVTGGKSVGLYNLSNNDFEILDTKELKAPSFITAEGKYIYTFSKDENVTLIIYKLLNNKLEESDTLIVPSTSLTHLTFSKKHNLLIGCNYSDGTFFSAGVDSGKFTKLYTFEKQITDDRLSRCHCVLLDNNEDTVAIVNIALDSIYLYNIVKGELIYNDIIELPKGCGPRHAIYNKEGTLLYVMTEYSNEVIVVDAKTKKIVQKISTIPTFTGETFGATLVFNNKYNLLYASNRGEDSITKFKVLDSGKLDYVKSFSCGGKHPRHMIISNNNKYLISCNKNSHNVSIIDLKTEKVILDIPFTDSSGVVEVKEN